MCTDLDLERAAASAGELSVVIMHCHHVTVLSLIFQPIYRAVPLCSLDSADFALVQREKFATPTAWSLSH